MSSGFRFAIAFTLPLEGGYVSDDAGHGATNWGINATSHPGLDIQALTEDDAVAIYRSEYWTALHLDLLPIAVAVAVFDSAVNQGPPTAIRLLQIACGVGQDGVIGPLTAAAARRTPISVLDVFCALRGVRYAQTPAFATYGQQWLGRLLACHAYARSLL